mmetsp:Transcript_94755/g.306414  ORF Transcript_94755/g.306414 Transcript_94755/m.306414 type:complete len:240 (-) Transcript_94755:212-931(-)
MGAALGHRKETKTLMVGLDSAGKTTILNKLRIGEVVTTLPYAFLRIETAQYKNMKMLVTFTVFDVGGRDKIRVLWRPYYKQCNSLIFVVNSIDRFRIGEAKEQLDKMYEEEECLMGVPLLVFANKQDLPDAMSAPEVADKLGLDALPKSRRWFIQATCATTDDGLHEGMDWLQNALHGKEQDDRHCCEPLSPAQARVGVARDQNVGKDEHRSGHGGSGSDADTASTADTEIVAPSVVEI